MHNAVDQRRRFAAQRLLLRNCWAVASKSAAQACANASRDAGACMRAVGASMVKSTWPGVSMMLISVSPHMQCVAALWMVMPFSRSSCMHARRAQIGSDRIGGPRLYCVTAKTELKT
eukprot:2686317-Pleurochrysis_carterae.AAC.2